MAEDVTDTTVRPIMPDLSTLHLEHGDVVIMKFGAAAYHELERIARRGCRVVHAVDRDVAVIYANDKFEIAKPTPEQARDIIQRLWPYAATPIDERPLHPTNLLVDVMRKTMTRHRETPFLPDDIAEGIEELLAKFVDP